MKKFTLFFVACITCLLMLQLPQLNAQWSGTGLSGAPYQISNQTDLETLATEINNDATATYAGAYFVLTADINLSLSGDGWVPIGYYGPLGYSPFMGIFDGAGFTISNLWIDKPTENCMGLFGCVDYPATITNLKVEIDLTNKVEGNNYVGGLVGYMSGAEITDCQVTGGDVKGLSMVGGFVGDAGQSIISKCYATNDVETTSIGYSAAGGFVGWADGNFNFSECFAMGNVTTVGQAAGGFAGILDTQNGIGTIENCYATGNASGQLYAGGFCGLTRGTSGNHLSISNCYAAANSVTITLGVAARGGFCGFIENIADVTFSNCYYDDKVGEIYPTGNCSSLSPTWAGISSVSCDLIGALPTGFSSSIWDFSNGSYPFLLDISVPYMTEDISGDFTNSIFEGIIRTAIGISTGPFYPCDVAGINALDVSGMNIGSLNGLQWLVGLESLDCSDNDLGGLPNLPAGLITLDCSDNHIAELPNLPEGLLSLTCISNNIAELPSLPAGLQKLYCKSNQISVLPSLTTTLLEFDCSYNQIVELPSLSSVLYYFDCSYNQIAKLPDLSPLTTLICSNNPLVGLPELPGTLETLDCSNTTISIMPGLPGPLTWLDCSNNNIAALPTLSALTYLNCSNNQLPGLPALPGVLDYFNCGNNLLPALPGLPGGLTTLICNNNLLTGLPGLPNLLYLDCSNNFLTGLPDLTTSLVYFDCSNNQLPGLPWMIGLANLEVFKCSGNFLTALHALPGTGGTTGVLKELDCSHNDIGSLSGGSFLIGFEMPEGTWNQRGFPATLEILNCSDNYITGFSVDELSLTYLNVSMNEMTNESDVEDFTETFDGSNYIFSPQRGDNTAPELELYSGTPNNYPTEVACGENYDFAISTIDNDYTGTKVLIKITLTPDVSHLINVSYWQETYDPASPDYSLPFTGGVAIYDPNGPEDGFALHNGTSYFRITGKGNSADPVTFTVSMKLYEVATDFTLAKLELPEVTIQPAASLEVNGYPEEVGCPPECFSVTTQVSECLDFDNAGTLVYGTVTLTSDDDPDVCSLIKVKAWGTTAEYMDQENHPGTVLNFAPNCGMAYFENPEEGFEFHDGNTAWFCIENLGLNTTPVDFVATIRIYEVGNPVPLVEKVLPAATLLAFTRPTVAVSFNGSPIIEGEEVTMCQGQNIDFAFTGTAPYALYYKLKINGTPITDPLTTIGLPYPIVSPNDTYSVMAGSDGTFVFTFEDLEDDNCKGTADIEEFTAIVAPAPTLILSNTNHGTIYEGDVVEMCQGETIDFTFTGTPDFELSYTLTWNGSTVDPADLRLDNPIIVNGYTHSIIAGMPGTFVFTFGSFEDADNPCHGFAIHEFTAVVAPAPTLLLTYNGEQIYEGDVVNMCQGEFIKLTAPNPDFISTDESTPPYTITYKVNGKSPSEYGLPNVITIDDEYDIEAGAPGTFVFTLESFTDADSDCPGFTISEFTAKVGYCFEIIEYEKWSEVVPPTTECEDVGRPAYEIPGGYKKFSQYEMDNEYWTGSAALDNPNGAAMANYVVVNKVLGVDFDKMVVLLDGVESTKLYYTTDDLTPKPPIHWACIDGGYTYFYKSYYFADKDAEGVWTSKWEEGGPSLGYNFYKDGVLIDSLRESSFLPQIVIAPPYEVEEYEHLEKDITCPNILANPHYEILGGCINLTQEDLNSEYWYDFSDANKAAMASYVSVNQVMGEDFDKMVIFKDGVETSLWYVDTDLDTKWACTIDGYTYFYKAFYFAELVAGVWETNWSEEHTIEYKFYVGTTEVVSIPGNLPKVFIDEPNIKLNGTYPTEIKCGTEYDFSLSTNAGCYEGTRVNARLMLDNDVADYITVEYWETPETYAEGTPKYELVFDASGIAYLNPHSFAFTTGAETFFRITNNGNAPENKDFQVHICIYDIDDESICLARCTLAVSTVLSAPELFLSPRFPEPAEIMCGEVYDFGVATTAGCYEGMKQKVFATVVLDPPTLPDSLEIWYWPNGYEETPFLDLTDAFVDGELLYDPNAPESGFTLRDTASYFRLINKGNAETDVPFTVTINLVDAEGTVLAGPLVLDQGVVIAAPSLAITDEPGFDVYPHFISCRLSSPYEFGVDVTAGCSEGNNVIAEVVFVQDAGLDLSDITDHLTVKFWSNTIPEITLNLVANNGVVISGTTGIPLADETYYFSFDNGGGSLYDVPFTMYIRLYNESDFDGTVFTGNPIAELELTDAVILPDPTMKFTPGFDPYPEEIKCGEVYDFGIKTYAGCHVGERALAQITLIPGMGFDCEDITGNIDIYYWSEVYDPANPEDQLDFSLSPDGCTLIYDPTAITTGFPLRDTSSYFRIARSALSTLPDMIPFEVEIKLYDFNDFDSGLGEFPATAEPWAVFLLPETKILPAPTMEIVEDLPQLIECTGEYPLKITTTGGCYEGEMVI
ncbi:MAG: hypothetical protein FWH59_02045, partial [Lentimicrobiaceae bacterium]|nr:hypothetical protein [Lentimicrobiaceae bacterium]